MNILNSVKSFALSKYSVGVVPLLYFGRQYFNGPFASRERDVKNQVIIVTGASAGIGKAAALDLLSSGATVVFACRNKEKTMNIINSISSLEERERARFIQCNLSSFASVRQFVTEFTGEFDRLDILINNAGTYPDNEPSFLTEDKVEVTWQSNHFGHYLLTTLLLEAKAFNQTEGRIINVSSWGHRRARLGRLHKLFDSTDKGKARFDAEIASATDEATKLLLYADTKLANVLFTQWLMNKVLIGEYGHISTYCLHPGVVLTEIWKGLMENASFLLKSGIYLSYPFIWYFSKDIIGGAQTTLQLVYANKNSLQNGEFYQDTKQNPMRTDGYNEELYCKMAKFSKELTKSNI